MERTNHLVTPGEFRGKLKETLGKLWTGLDVREKTKDVSEEDSDEEWENLFDNIRQVVIRAASEPGFPIDFNFGETPFSHYAKMMTNVDTEGKLKKLVVRAGTAEEVTPNSVVYVFYKAYLEKQEYPFISSHMHSHEPRRYHLGSGSLCGGFEAAMTTMRVGEKSHFLLAPEIAFGKNGRPPKVPPDAEVLVEIELCDIVRNDYRKLKPIHSYGKEYYESVKNIVEELHTLANKLNKSGNFTSAIINYRKAENLLTTLKCISETDEINRREMLLKMIINQIITYISGNKSLTQPQSAINAGLRAFQHIPKEASLSIKLKYNLCKACMLLNEEEKAFQFIKGARKLNPDDVYVINLYNKLEKQLNEKHENETKCWMSISKIFPEHKTKEEYSSFLKASMKMDLETYLRNPLANMGLLWQYKPEERSTLCQLAEKLNVIYEEHKSSPNNVLISLHKRGRAMLLTEREEIFDKISIMQNGCCSDDDDEEEEFKGWSDEEVERCRKRRKLDNEGNEVHIMQQRHQLQLEPNQKEMITGQSRYHADDDVIIISDEDEEEQEEEEEIQFYQNPDEPSCSGLGKYQKKR